MMPSCNPRHPFRVAGMAAAAMILSCAQTAAPATAAQAKDAPHPMVIAHRGGAMLRPENTMPAFRHAAEIGVDILEFDMEMTADDRIVIHHDAAINPQFCSPDAGASVTAGPVRALRFAETQQFDCGSGVRPIYAGDRHVAAPGARIPTLDDVLGMFRSSKALFFAETKVPKDVPDIAKADPIKFAMMLDAAVRKYGLEDRLILQSFDFRTIDALHEINPRIRTCLLGAQKLTHDYLAILRQHHASCIVLSAADVDAEGVQQLRTAGMLVYSDVVDRPEDWSKYAALGMDAIFTNDPEGLIGYLKEAGLRG